MSEGVKAILGVLIICAIMVCVIVGVVHAIPYLYDYFGWH